ncbi:flavin-containing monooxygenase [Streptomyces sp. NPDC055078]
MPHQLPPTLSAADDETLRAVLEEADIPSLLAAVAHLTGDYSLLREDLRPVHDVWQVQGGLSEERQRTAREHILRALIRYRDDGGGTAQEHTPERLAGTLTFLFGDGMDEYIPFLSEQLVLGGDPGAPDWTTAEIAADTAAGPVVAVIGAGMSGLLAAHRLRQAGVDCVVLEKNEDVGGTWLENSYPGCRVDVPNHLYSYSFAGKDDWKQYYSSQPVLLDYFRGFADRTGVRESIRFGTEVVSATWSEASGDWTLVLRTAAGEESDLRVRAVISAVGQLNRPKYPRIKGMSDYTGHAFHSARWDHSVDLAGKRVAVVGTGASALQIVPAIAGQVAELAVFQRTAPWLAPSAEYLQDIPDGLGWLLQHVPGYSAWYRQWLFCLYVEGALAYITVDPDWNPKDRSVSELNDMLRKVRTQHLAAQAGDDPELLAKLVPGYAPGAKRMLRDDGTWVRTLRRDNVDLVTDPIQRFTERGIETSAGEREFDVIVYASGFDASNFLAPMSVRGRDGLELHEQWGGDARAHLGITVPGFPNFFCVYGPNTNIVVNGSIIFFSECAVHYILGCLRLLLEGGHHALEIAKDVHDAYNQRVDEGNSRMVWGASTVNSWYRNDLGRVSQNWPFSLLEYWQLTRSPNPGDFIFD